MDTGKYSEELGLVKSPIKLLKNVSEQPENLEPLQDLAQELLLLSSLIKNLLEIELLAEIL